jgi:hypothetical protein
MSRRSYSFGIHTAGFGQRQQAVACVSKFVRQSGAKLRCPSPALWGREANSARNHFIAGSH